MKPRDRAAISSLNAHAMPASMAARCETRVIGLFQGLIHIGPSTAVSDGESAAFFTVKFDLDRLQGHAMAMVGVVFSQIICRLEDMLSLG